jgi:ParB-like chromosome segregation protein Spo0J
MLNVIKFKRIKKAWTPLEGAASVPQTLPLDSVVLMPSVFQCREKMHLGTGVVDDLWVRELGTKLKDPTKDLEAITVLPTKKGYILIEGHHRLQAYRDRDRDQIPVEVFKGTPEAALKFGVEENQKIKLKMDRSDRVQRAWEFVYTELSFSKAEIAASTGVDPSTVARMRKKLAEFKGEGIKPPEQWRSAQSYNRGDGEGWSDRQVEEYRQRLVKAFGDPRDMTTGRRGFLADALIAWGESTAVYIAEEIIEKVGKEHTEGDGDD